MLIENLTIIIKLYIIFIDSLEKHLEIVMNVSLETKVEVMKKIANDAVNHNLNEMYFLGYELHFESNENVRREIFGSEKCARFVFGYCDYVNKMIVINEDHLYHSAHDEVFDTVIHECCHALAYHLDGDNGHGKHWKKWCRELGCNDKAKSAVDSDDIKEKLIADSKYVLVFMDDENKNIEYIGVAQRRLKNLRNRYMVRDKESTLGKLYLIRSEHYLNGSDYKEMTQHCFR